MGWFGPSSGACSCCEAVVDCCCQSGGVTNFGAQFVIALSWSGSGCCTAANLPAQTNAAKSAGTCVWIGGSDLAVFNAACCYTDGTPGAYPIQIASRIDIFDACGDPIPNPVMQCRVVLTFAVHEDGDCTRAFDPLIDDVFSHTWIFNALNCDLLDFEFASNSKTFVTKFPFEEPPFCGLSISVTEP